MGSATMRGYGQPNLADSTALRRVFAAQAIDLTGASISKLAVVKTKAIFIVGVRRIIDGRQFLRATIRRKDGKDHRYWSLVESKRVSGGRVVQRHVLYLGEINSSQELAWRKSIEVLEEGADRPRSLALFPEDRCEGVLPDAPVVRLRLSQVRLSRPRQWGACWLAVQLWEELRLDRFWSDRLPASRKGTRWGSGAVGARSLPTDHARRGVALAARVVRPQRDGGFARRECGLGRQPHALPLP